MDKEYSESRFNKIEEKLDKLSEAMVSLARTEEKILAMEKDRTNQTERLNRLSQKLDDVNDRVMENSRITANISKVIWLFMSAAIAAVVGQYFMSR